MISSFLAEIDTSLLGYGIEPVLLDGLEGFCRETELEVSLPCLPPNPLVLQVHKLELLGLVVGERDLVSPVSLLPSEGAYSTCKMRLNI